MTAAASAISFQSDNAGFICGFRFEPGKPGVTLDPSGITDTFRHVEGGGVQDIFIWLHFNLSRAGRLRWLQGYLELSEPLIELLGREAHSTRIEQQDGVLVAVFNSMIFDFERTPTQMATQWVHTHRHLPVTLHRKPLHSVGRLHECVHSGETSRPPADLLGHLMCDQTDLMTQIIHTTSIGIDRAEDRFLASKITPERQEPAGTRHMLMRLQHMLAPEPGSVFRLPAQPSTWLHPENAQQSCESTEEFSVVLHDMNSLIERIKLLQEEVIARLDEQNNGTLFALTLVAMPALPINTVTGLFGMNVGDVSLTNNHHGFWLMVGLVAAFTVVVAQWMVRRRSNR